MFFVQAALSKVGKKPLLRSGNRCLTIKTKKEMKKNLFMVAAVALVALVSCNKETNSPLQPAPVSDIKFEAEFVNEQTKTSIGEADKNGYRNVTWDLGEEVYINGTLFTATGRKEDGKAIFETKDLNFATAEQYDAIYPATAGTSLDAVTIPAAQDGTFANAAIAVAQSENRSLAFMNVASLIKFQVPAAYASVTIESTANLAGAVPVSFNEDGVPVIGEVTNASKVITLENVNADVDYYVAVLPGDHKFTFNIDGRLSKEATQTLTATRAGILALGVLPKPAKLDRNLAFSAATATATMGETFTAPTLSGVTDGVTYTSSEPTVATVDANGTVNVLAAGETTITASAEATEVYNAGSASYKLTVENPLTDWNLIGAIGTINMVKSDTYTDLYVAKNVTLDSNKKFKFVNKDNTKTVGAWGTSGDVDTKEQINQWYGSDATASYGANIFVSTAGQYDVYFSPTNLDFLIIKTGVECVDSDWEVVGWFNGKDTWSGNSGYSLQLNYILVAHSITIDLNADAYIKLLKNKSWDDKNGGGWIGTKSDTTYNLDVDQSAEVSTYHSYGDHNSQFHIKNAGTYRITANIGDYYKSVKVKITRIK